MDEPDSEVEVRLTHDEALVLFELLSRYSNCDVLEVKDPAEQIALWNLCCMLEKVLVEPWQGDYQALLDHARARMVEGRNDPE
ncbi:MAG TPA: hypothetical protein VHD36_13455 [Pirellulales bacterium]|nr:hypothetical protein [Pirellulales bacterium]